MNVKLVEYLSRKFVLSLLALFFSVTLAWYGKDMSGFVQAIIAILGFYSGSNVYQEYLASRKGLGTKEKEDDKV